VNAGCAHREQVAEYKFRKNVSDEKAPSAPQATRMVVGIVQRDSSCWFFKISGAVAAVKDTEEAWSGFLRSISFGNDGKPEWRLPDGWQMKGARPGRFATLAVPDTDPPLEVAISTLRGQQDLPSNVDRWRGQLGLSPIDDGDVNKHLNTSDNPNVKMLIFDETGKDAGGGMMPPFARGGAPKVPSTPIKGDSNEPKFEYVIPEGWEKDEKAQVVTVRLNRKNSDGKMAISVTRMALSFNDWATQARQWAGDLQLELSAERVKELTKKVEVDSVSAQRISLTSEPRDGQSETIEGVMLVKGGFTWFVKMKGDSKLVQESLAGFENFLKSIRIK
jgi:hypothetical protein